ncbi:hypothetical protein KFK09_004276 [Dendrobium nobile]|uniref:Reverse transcriptase zinc-binding domain-containing protein n=1 Tax=Dendrobium nobile TaxID=94219 RepID=A0A8T3BZZ3_DENNO|nr:hypothetical protein KFK09_004276 [Dendrobium nobile]
MCKFKWDMESALFWGLGYGNVFFWHDKWLGKDSIDSLMHTSSFDSVKVNFFFKDNGWDVDKLSNFVPNCVIFRILNFTFNIHSKDVIMCDCSNDGAFQIKHVWLSFRSKRPFDKIFSNIWHKSIPKTISVFMWRILHNLLPTEDNLIKKGFSFASKCQCCFKYETMHHIFISGPVAVKTWVFFDDLFHLNIFNAHLSLKAFMKAWLVEGKGNIRNTIPTLVLWFIWLERNNSVFNGVKMNHLNIIHRVKDKVLGLVAVNLISVKNFTNYSQLASYFGLYKSGNPAVCMAIS